MRGSLLRWVAALVVLHPGLAMAQWSLRLALEAPLHTHVFLVDGTMTSTSIADTFQPGVDLLGGYAVLDTLSIDLEFQTGLFATGSGYARTRTTIGPGMTYDPHFPLYARVAVPSRSRAAWWSSCAWGAVGSSSTSASSARSSSSPWTSPWAATESSSGAIR